MTIYTGTAHRDDRWWVVHVDGIGTTQGRSETEAKFMADDLVAAMTETPIGDVDVDVTFHHTN